MQLHRGVRLVLVVLTVLSSVSAFLATAGPARAGLLPSALPLPAAPLAGLPVVLGDTTSTVPELLQLVGAAQKSLQTSAAAMQAQVQAIAAAAPSDPAGAPTAVEGAVLSALPGSASTALSLALKLATVVSKPDCPALGALAHATSGLSVPTMPDYSAFGPFESAVRTNDRKLSTTMHSYYLKAFAALLSPAALPDAPDPANGYVVLAKALLDLLRIDWSTTTYAASGAPLVRVTPAYMGLPTLIDIDRNAGVDICANVTMNLATLAMHEQIDRVPLADPAMVSSVKVNALSGLVESGYDTPAGSHIPAMFDTTHDVNGTSFATTVTGAGPSLSQTHGIGSVLFTHIDTQGTPASYSVTSDRPGGGVGLHWQASQPARSMNFETFVGGILTRGIAAADPAPTRFDLCSSSRSACTNQPDADPTATNPSMHVLANEDTSASIYSSAADRTGSVCPSIPTVTHLRVRELYFAKKSTSPGFAWMDTNNTTVSGCVATAAVSGTFPSGTAAQDRLATFAGTPAALVSASGSITCPPGFAISSGSVPLVTFLCSSP